MRSRAAILPYPGDPFLLNYWLSFFDRIWGDEVDKLYVYLNSPIEKPVVEYIRNLCLKNPKINFTYEDHQIEHGEVINRALDLVTEDLVLLIEDDGFVFKKGEINRCFEAIESGNYDVVGSKRGSCSLEILERAKQIHGLNYEGEGDQGCNFWPNFFFCHKELLLKTDRQFAARAWQAGEEIVSLSRPNDPYYAKELVVSDTFVNASLQILNFEHQSRILYVPQYHGSPDDLDHYDRQYNLFNGQAGWCHVGSLSSGVGGILQDGKGRALARRLIDPERESGALPNYCNSEGEKREWERRVQWWKTFWEYSGNAEELLSFPGMLEFYKLYGEAINRIIEEYQLIPQYIQRRQNVYRSIGL